MSKASHQTLTININQPHEHETAMGDRSFTFYIKPFYLEKETPETSVSTAAFPVLRAALFLLKLLFLLPLGVFFCFS